MKTKEYRLQEGDNEIPFLDEETVGVHKWSFLDPSTSRQYKAWVNNEKRIFKFYTKFSSTILVTWISAKEYMQKANA